MENPALIWCCFPHIFFLWCNGFIHHHYYYIPFLFWYSLQHASPPCPLFSHNALVFPMMLCFSHNAHFGSTHSTFALLVLQKGHYGRNKTRWCSHVSPELFHSVPVFSPVQPVPAISDTWLLGAITAILRDWSPYFRHPPNNNEPQKNRVPVKHHIQTQTACAPKPHEGTNILYEGTDILYLYFLHTVLSIVEAPT